MTRAFYIVKSLTVTTIIPFIKRYMLNAALTSINA
jgi:hypothetical protein